MAVVETDLHSTIQENRYGEPVINLDYLVPYELRPSIEEMELYELPDEYIACPTDDMGLDHSKDHAARVLFWTFMYRGYHAAKGHPLPDAECEALHWYASLHDSQRFNDGYDRLHGKRGAIQAGIYLTGRAPPYVIQRTQHFCRIHVPNDERVRAYLDYPSRIAKECDMLDRGRGCNDLNRKYCRLPVTQAFIHHARLLHEASMEETTGNPFSRVVTAGARLGYIRSALAA